MRGENQWLQREYNIASCDFDNYYFGLVHSIYAIYAIEESHNFNFSHTHRFDTPDIAKITPFVSYANFSYTVGNSELHMCYPQNIEAGWTHYTMWESIGVEGHLNLNTDYFAQISDATYSTSFGYVVQMDTVVNVGDQSMNSMDLRPIGH